MQTALNTGEGVRNVRLALRALFTAMLCSGLAGCVMVGGSSRGGFFFLPGGFGLLLLIGLFVLLSRRR